MYNSGRSSRISPGLQRLIEYSGSRMTDQELEHLVQMANQIAANFSFHKDQAERTADHIQRFWAPSMRQLLAGHIQAGGEGLDEAVLKAMKEVSSA